MVPWYILSHSALSDSSSCRPYVHMLAPITLKFSCPSHFLRKEEMMRGEQGATRKHHSNQRQQVYQPRQEVTLLEEHETQGKQDQQVQKDQGEQSD